MNVGMKILLFQRFLLTETRSSLFTFFKLKSQSKILKFYLSTGVKIN